MFDCLAVCRLAEVCDATLAQRREFGGEGLWAGVLSSGQCALEGPGEPQLAGAGSLIVGGGPFALIPTEPGHLLAVRLAGSAPAAFLAQQAGPFWARGASSPVAAELLSRLCAPSLPPHRQSAAGYELLCELAGADSAPPLLPPLVVAALASMRENYAGLYGVEELSAQLGVSKSHLVRVFSAAMGMPPGRYLTQVRVEAAKHLLAHREYPLEVVASLCGFSGANYLCRVFRHATGMTPTAWRAAQTAAQAPAGFLPRENELYV